MITNDGKFGTCICISLSLLFVGMIIYLLFRQDAIFINWLGDDVLNRFRITVKNRNDNIFIHWFLFSVPDGLWYAALLIMQLPFIKGNRLNLIIFGIAVLLPFVMEIMQYFDCIPGTFDRSDIFTYLLTLIIFLLCAKSRLFKS